LKQPRRHELSGKVATPSVGEEITIFELKSLKDISSCCTWERKKHNSLSASKKVSCIAKDDNLSEIAAEERGICLRSIIDREPLIGM